MNMMNTFRYTAIATKNAAASFSNDTFTLAYISSSHHLSNPSFCYHHHLKFTYEEKHLYISGLCPSI
ncbi:hypothetical protein T01_4871 [Trichinella spiralis]|uniref:Uncharacterized protein n=1 Tax=Trichinella spiralis TaxID=6334 RepID=A0A0V1BTU0_TRISP|nr:hypothetical protein T01_4871 [Trichinella spiralis]